MEQVTIQLDKRSRQMMCLWYGVLIYCAGSALADIEVPFVFLIGVLVGVPMALYGLLPSMEWAPPQRADGRRSWQARYVFFYLLLAWCVFMWAHSDVKELLTPVNYYSSYDVLPYLSIALLVVPVARLVRSLLAFAYRTYRWYWALCLLPLIDVWNYGFNQTLVETFLMASVVLFLTNKYHRPRTLICAVVSLILGFLMCTLTARRNMMLTIALYMMVGSCSYVFGNKIKSLENRIVIIASAALFLLTALYVFMADSSGAFSLIAQRASENTRDGVLLGFMLDMDTVQDWVVGRGLFGTYYCPGIDDVDAEYRSAIECGYLHDILKGGCVYLALYLVTVITALVRGFRAHNQLCTASAWILLIQLLDMVPFGLHAFNTKTFVIWTAVAICLSRELCSRSDAEISAEYFEQPTTPLPWQRS
jgi:hypothetical protein